jgi:hypothetical protein
MASCTRRSAIIGCLAAFLATVTGCARERPPATGERSASAGERSASAGERSASAEYRGVDFSQDQEANYAAGQLGQRLMRFLPGMPGYAGMQIVRTGIQVEVVGSPTPEMRSVVARHGLRHQGSEIPVRFHSVRYSEKELQAVQNQITADRDDWAKRGIELSSWGIDLDSNTVEITLERYTKAFGTALLERYGDRVTVYPHDYTISFGVG